MASGNQDLNQTPTTGYSFAPATSDQSIDFLFPLNAGLSTANNNTSTAATQYLYPYHTVQDAESLIATAQALVNPRGRGIYATDEAPEGIDERLAAAEELEGKDKGKNWTEEEKRDRRRKWRECLYKSMPSGTFLISS